MVYVKSVIPEMFQKTYVIRDLSENRLVIHDRNPPPPFTTLKIDDFRYSCPKTFSKSCQDSAGTQL